MAPAVRSHVGIETAVGTVILTVLVLGYAFTLRAGAWPPGHPWALLTLAPLSLLQFQAGARHAAMGAERSANRFNAAATCFSVLTLACWVLAVALR
jgi:hypothetical protein